MKFKNQSLKLSHDNQKKLFCWLGMPQYEKVMISNKKNKYEGFHCYKNAYVECWRVSFT